MPVLYWTGLGITDTQNYNNGKCLKKSIIVDLVMVTVRKNGTAFHMSIEAKRAAMPEIADIGALNIIGIMEHFQ